MAIYDWQQSDWPHFSFSLEKREEELVQFSEKAA